MTPAAAHRAAHLALGGIEQTKSVTATRARFRGSRTRGRMSRSACDCSAARRCLPLQRRSRSQSGSAPTAPFSQWPTPGCFVRQRRWSSRIGSWISARRGAMAASTPCRLQPTRTSLGGEVTLGRVRLGDVSACDEHARTRRRRDRAHYRPAGVGELLHGPRLTIAPRTWLYKSR